MRNKDEVGEKFLIYDSEVENQLNKKIKRLKIDKGGEYYSSILMLIVRIMASSMDTSLFTNSVAKREIKTLKNIVNAMLP